MRVVAAGFAALVPACVAPVDLGGGTAAEVKTDPTVHTALPAVPAMTNVVPTVTTDTVGIDFDPVDDAVDYRVYPLPPDSDVTVNPDHSVTIRNAVYRCAGARQTFDLENDTNMSDSALVRTRAEFSWNATVRDDPVLGYVYVAPGAGRVPVYAVAGDATTDEAGWRESRTKIYTTDAKERDALLARNYRDDGVVFYVPSTASAATQQIHRSIEHVVVGGGDYQHYFGDADLDARAKDETPPRAAFPVLKAASADTKPLMVVGYDNQGHDELTVGKERFARAAHQGKGPLFHVEWSGLTKKTTLVVEALDAGCPYQGLLAASHVEALPHQTFETLDDARHASSTGEVFVNGQYDGAAAPKAIARSFVTAEPSVASGWDFYEGFAGTSGVEPLTDLPTNNCFRCIRKQSSKFEMNFERIDEQSNTDVLSFGVVLGQFWVAYDDTDGGTLGRADLTALEKANIDTDPARYLHVSLSTGIAATNRRFPELVISDQDPPTSRGFENPDNDSLVLELRGGPEVRAELHAVHGLVNGTPWSVDNADPDAQAGHDLTEVTPGAPSPIESMFEHAGLDRMTRFDVYVSSSRYYVFMDGKPLGCTVLPGSVMLSGPVSVTFGDVFFDEGAEPEVCDASRPFDFQHRHQCHETTRHFDDLAFKSGVTLPAWDETRVACTPY